MESHSQAPEEMNELLTSRRAGLLSKSEIIKYKLIRDHQPSRMQGTSYDLSLGEGHFVYDKHENSWEWNAYYLAQNLSEKNVGRTPLFKPQNPAHHTILRIPPFGGALVQLYETVDTHSVIAEHDLLIAGRFDLKLNLVRKGLVSQQATQVEPCYEGKLFCFLFNQTSLNVELEYLTPISCIEFHYVSCLCSASRQSKSETIEALRRKFESRFPVGNFSNGRGITDVRYFAHSDTENEGLPEEGGMARFYSEFEEIQKTHRDVMSLKKDLLKLIGIGLVVFGLLLTLLIFVWNKADITGRDETLVETRESSNLGSAEINKPQKDSILLTTDTVSDSVANSLGKDNNKKP